MNDYYEVRFSIEPASEDASDLLCDALGEIGFESFVSDDLNPGATLTAYVPATAMDDAAVAAACGSTGMDVAIRFEKTFVEGQDWNAEWEKNYFQPIVIGDQCVVHSSFHTDVPKARYDIVIDPKMAFGTGHHATTSLMAENILALDLEGRRLVDMGTGTGILAILAAMRGAAEITAVEIDGFAYENACENFRLNGVDGVVTPVLGDASSLDSIAEGSVDVFLANINRNIITGDIAAYSRVLASGGTMLLSGFYEEDIPVVEAAAAPCGLVTSGHDVRDRWTCLKLKKA